MNLNNLLKLFLIVNLIFVSNLFAMKRSSEDDVNSLKNEAITSVYEVGLKYLEEKNYPEAFKFFNSAQYLGHHGGTFYVALMTLNGWAIKQNYNEAYRLFGILANSPHANAVYHLALRHLNGKVYKTPDGIYTVGVPNDVFRWFSLPVEDKHSYGDYSFYKGHSTAFNLFQLLANNGHIGAIRHLGLMHLNKQGKWANPKEAIKWLMMAAEKGCIESMFYIGQLYFEGENIDKDYYKAFEWFSKAAKKGDLEAIGYLADMYHYGYGVNEDQDKALEYALIALNSEDEVNREEMEVLIDFIYDAKKEQYRIFPEN